MGFISLFKHPKEQSPPLHQIFWPGSNSFGSGSDQDEDGRSLFGDEEELVESIIKDPSKDRLFFEPTKDVRLMVEKTKVSKEQVWGGRECPFEEGVIVVMDMAKDPYFEFRVAMEEMVAARGGVVDYKWLQEMLEWYLRVNSKTNHLFIVEAFMDLILKSALSSF